MTAFAVPATSSTLEVSISSLTATDDVSVTGYLVTETSTAPAANDARWSATAPISYTFGTPGSRTLHAWAKDAAGNVSASLSASVDVLDVTAATVTAFTLPATSDSLTVPISSFTASDDVAVTGYLVTETSTAPAAGDAGWTTSPTASFTFATPGAKTLFAWAKDAAGNVSTSRSASVDVLDVTAPTVTAFTLPATSDALTVPITSFTATDDVAVTGYLVSESSTAPAAGDAAWTAAAPTSYTFDAPGLKTLHAWAKDADGNVSTGRSAFVDVLDLTAPTVTAFAVPSSSGTLDVFVTSFTATDDVAVTGYLVTESSTAPAAGDAGWSAVAPLSYTFAAPGSRTLFAWAKDGAGNVSTGRSASVDVLDVTAPTVTAFTLPATSNTLAVAVTSFSATDDVGVTGYLLTESSTTPAVGDAGWTASPPASFTFAAPGAKTLHAWARDAAGNVSASGSASVDVLDVIAPTVTAFTLPATSAALTVPVSSFTATDDVAVTGYLVTETSTAPAAGDAGWTATPPASFTFAAPGSKTLFAWARDAAGNVSTGRSASVDVLDVTAPTVTAFTVPAVHDSITVPITSFTATDDVAVTGYLVTETSTAPAAGDAGWTGSPPTSFTFAAVGPKTLHAWAKDAAGNVSTGRSASVTITLPRPEPAGWYAGDPHVHRSCGGPPEGVASLFELMNVNDLTFMSVLADMGNGEVQDPVEDLPRVDGLDDPLSTPGRIMHWDAEWHWDPIYLQYPHQVLGGHVLGLGLSHAEQRLDEHTAPVLQWARAQAGATAGFAHMQYLDGFIPSDLTCCTPLEYPVEVALGTAAFVSEDVVSGDQPLAMGMDAEAAIQAYYRLLNTGFRPGLAAGTDYPCNGGAPPGALLTYVRIPPGQPVTYQSWVQGLAAGRTVVSRNGHREFLDLLVNGTSGPGDQVDLAAGGGTVTVNVTWTANQTVDAGTLQLVVNGSVVANQPASMSPTTLTTSIPFTGSGWIAARRMTANGHQVQTGAVFVRVDALPVRASAADAYYFMQWIDNLLAHTVPAVGDWAPFFPNDLATVRARYQAARDVFQGVLSSSGPVAPQGIFTTEVPTTPPFNDGSPLELGTRFRTDMNGTITGVRIYAAAGEQGVHSVRIWQAGNPVPVSGPDDWEIVSGPARWVTFSLPTPLAVAAGPEYTLSVSTGSDFVYAAQRQTFAGEIVNGHLRAPRSAGVFSTTLGARPTQSFDASGYFRDVVFVPIVP